MSGFRVNHSGLRRYTDSALTDGATIEVTLEPNRGLLLYPVDGRIRVTRAGADELVLDAEESVHPEGPGDLAIAWSDKAERRLTLTALTALRACCGSSSTAARMTSSWGIRTSCSVD